MIRAECFCPGPVLQEPLFFRGDDWRSITRHFSYCLLASVERFRGYQAGRIMTG